LGTAVRDVCCRIARVVSWHILPIGLVACGVGIRQCYRRPEKAQRQRGKICRHPVSALEAESPKESLELRSIKKRRRHLRPGHGTRNRLSGQPRLASDIYGCVCLLGGRFCTLAGSLLLRENRLKFRLAILPGQLTILNRIKKHERIQIRFVGQGRLSQWRAAPAAAAQ
jgi:hypothetical protein